MVAIATTCLKSGGIFLVIGVLLCVTYSEIVEQNAYKTSMGLEICVLAFEKLTFKETVFVLLIYVGNSSMERRRCRKLHFKCRFKRRCVRKANQDPHSSVFIPQTK